jgi:hypothetical protein
MMESIATLSSPALFRVGMMIDTFGAGDGIGYLMRQ